VLCAIYKLAHGANFLVCNELFAIGKSTVSKVLHEFVIAMNFVFKKLIASPIRIEMAIVMENFKQWCGLLNVHGAIDNTHIIIYKPITLFPEDYYHHKLVTIQVQVVVDFNKFFLEFYVGFPGSVNNVKVLCRSTLYCHALYHNLFDLSKGVEGIFPYLFGGQGLPANQLDNDVVQRRWTTFYL